MAYPPGLFGMSIMIERKANPRPRWTLEDLPDGIRLRIAPRSRWFQIVFTLLWLVGWAIGEGNAIGELIAHRTSNEQPLKVWLTGWTIAGIAILSMVLWRVAGEVVLEVTQGVFRHRLAIGPFSVARSYDIYMIHDLRSSAVASGASAWLVSRDRGSRGRGLVLFDYGDRSVTIRPDLEPNEATNAVNLLARHIPSSAY
ncbi:MAG: hypothetical protein ACREMY_05125 [bacterium]